MPSVFFADNLVGAQILADFAPKDERAAFAYQLYRIVARPPVVHQEDTQVTVTWSAGIGRQGSLLGGCL